MNKTITIILLTLFSINTINAQCTTGFNGNNTVFTQAIKTGQTFQVSCTGLLSTIVFNPTNPNIDDLRGQNIFVGVRLRDNAGAIIATATINGAANTDQWFNGATVTANFSAANITLNTNTTYRWEVFETTDNTPLYLFGRNNTNPYELGILFEDNNSFSGVDAEDWTVNVEANLSSELFEKENISVYPNPSKGVFTIENKNIVFFEVFDLTGKMIKTNTASSSISSIDLTTFETGVYFVKLTNDKNEVSCIKLLKK